MSEHGTMQVWHPRGVLVTLPLGISEGFYKVALANVSAALDAGFLVQAPGLVPGEEKDDVGWVLRGEHEHEGKSTPFLLLYSRKDMLTWSFLKVYLNKDEDVRAFESASHLVFEKLPLYVGNDKPQRGSSNKTDRFIVAAPKPFGVVYKSNPKYDPNEPDPTKKKAARLFVRWADTAPATNHEASEPAGEPFTPVSPVDDWKGKLAFVGGDLSALNLALPEVKALPDGTRQTVWALVVQHAKGQGWEFDAASKKFVAVSTQARLAVGRQAMEEARKEPAPASKPVARPTVYADEPQASYDEDNIPF